MNVRRLLLSLFSLIMPCLCAFSSVGCGGKKKDTGTECGAFGHYYNGKRTKGSAKTVTAASCKITTYDPALCKKGDLNKFGSFAHLAVLLDSNAKNNAQVGYCKGDLTAEATLQYYYEFWKDGENVGFEYDLGTPASGDQEYMVERSGNDWIVRWGNGGKKNSKDHVADCATCDAGQVNFLAETWQTETQCVGGKNNKVSFSECKVIIVGAKADDPGLPPGWTTVIGTKDQVGPRNDEAQKYYKQDADTNKSFKIYDNRY